MGTQCANSLIHAKLNLKSLKSENINGVSMDVKFDVISRFIKFFYKRWKLYFFQKLRGSENEINLVWLNGGTKKYLGGYFLCYVILVK